MSRPARWLGVFAGIAVRGSYVSSALSHAKPPVIVRWPGGAGSPGSKAVTDGVSGRLRKYDPGDENNTGDSALAMPDRRNGKMGRARAAGAAGADGTALLPAEPTSEMS